MGVPLLGVGGAQAAPAGAPTLSGYYIIGNGAALVAVGYVGWANVWTPAGNGSQIYSQGLYLAFFNLRSVPTVVPIDVKENGVWVSNTTLNVAAVTENAVTITLPQITTWSAVTLYFYGVATWYGWVATPVSLLPNYILNIGGLDLFALTLVSFMLINAVGGYALGRWAMRRAIWAPKFSLLIWGHVIIVAIAGGVFLDYQAIDSTFAGWSPLVYPWFTFPMVFLTSLSYFNRGQRVQIQQGELTSNDEVGFALTEVRIGRLPTNEVVYVGEGWPHFVQRFFGHHAVAHDGDPKKPRPWFAPARHLLSPTASPRERRKAKRMAAAVAPRGAEALTKFPVLNSTEKDAVAYIAFGKGTEPPVVNFPYLSLHRWVKVDAEYAPSGVAGQPPVVVKEAGTKRVLAWPHYVDPEPSKLPDLEDYHYETAYAVWAKFASVRDLGRVYSKVAHAFSMLSAHLETRVNDEVYAQLRTFFSLIHRVSTGISEEEAARRTGDLAGLLDAGKGAKP